MSKRISEEGVKFDTFGVIQTARTPDQAFSLARQEALYWWGHAGYTGTIAEKDGYRVVGQINSRHAPYLETYLIRAEDWYRRREHKNRSKLPKGIPESAAPLFIEAIPIYVNESGPAVCFQITGTLARQIKADMGRKHTWDKVWWFGGRSPVR